jgi:alpha-amylase/alpha-mannosidase (GH57 family)
VSHNSKLPPIKLAILWHQHQPYYRAGTKFILPWVWLHATKDYLEMAQHIEQVPKMRATINLVPSLVKQIEEYLSGSSTDPVLEVMRKPSGSLTQKEKEFVLQNFFHANEHTMISRSTRYRELYDISHSQNGRRF